MVLAFLMKPGIVPTSVGRLTTSREKILSSLETMWYGFLEEEGKARAALLPLTFRKTNTG